MTLWKFWADFVDSNLKLIFPKNETDGILEPNPIVIFFIEMNKLWIIEN